MYHRFIIDASGQRINLNDIRNYRLVANPPDTEGSKEWISVEVLDSEGFVDGEYVLHQENETYCPIG